MADQELQRMQELLAQVNREYEQFGRILPQTQQQLNAARTGIKNFDMQLNLAGTAIKSVAGAFTSYTKEMYSGTRGAKAFNNSIDQMATAVQAASAGLSLLMPGGVVVKGLVAAIGFLAGEALKAGKTLGEQSDKIYDAFSGMARTGAIAGEGLTGLFDGLQKMGLGIDEANSAIELFANNADILAQFGGTVNRGRKQFESTIKEMEPFRSEMRALGLNQQDQNEAAMIFVRQMNRLNLVTKDNANITGAAAAGFVKEMDALTKATGFTRKQQEEAVEKAMRKQVFAATVDDLIARNQEKDARLLQTALRFAASQGEDFAEGLADAAAGNINTVASQKLFMSTNGEAQDLVQKITSGRIKDETQLREEFGRLAKTMGTVRQQMIGTSMTNVAEDFMLSYSTMSKVTKTATNDFVASFNKATTEIDDQTGKNVLGQDAALHDYVRMINAQQEAMLAEQKTMQLGVAAFTRQTANAAEAHEKVAKAALKAATELEKLGLGVDASTEAIEAQDEANYRNLELGDKVISSLLRANEMAGRLIAGAVGLVHEGAGQALQGGVATNRANRVRRETTNLEQAGRAPATSGTTGVGAGASNVSAPGAMPQMMAMTEEALRAAGLKIKQGGVQMENAQVSSKLIEIAKSVQAALGEKFGYISATNSPYHRDEKPQSLHGQGRAFDFVLANGESPTIEQGKQIVEQLKKLGASYAQDEYNFPSRGSTGKHFHVEVPKFGDGALVMKPQLAMIGEKGPEAVLPIEDLGSMIEDIKRSMEQSVSKLSQSQTDAIYQGMSNLGAYLEELIRTNKNSVDVQTKILQSNM